MTGSINVQAMAAVGHDEPGADWQLRPEAHAGALPKDAGGLRRVLERGEVKELMSRFADADRQAIRAQKTYKLFGQAAITLHAAAAIVGVSATTLLVLRPHWPLPWSAGFVQTPSDLALVLQYAFVLLASGAAQLLLRKRPFEVWQRQRAIAEVTRVDLFHFVASQEEPVQAGEIALLPLQLEYFRRYQLDVELRYYEGRGGQHARAAGRLSGRQRLYGVLATLAGAPLVYAAIGENLTAKTGLIFVGAVVPILLNANRARSLLSQDERNASHYRQTFENLRLLNDEYLQSAREAAEAGNRAAVLSFVEKVNEQISIEHKEWISLREDALHHDFETISQARLPNLPRKG